MAKVFSRYDDRFIFNPETSHLFPSVTCTLGFVSGAQRVREIERAGASLEYMRLLKSVELGEWLDDGSDAEDIAITPMDSRLDILEKAELLKERYRAYQEAMQTTPTTSTKETEEKEDAKQSVSD